MKKSDVTIKIAWKTRNLLDKFKIKTGIPIRRIVDNAVLMYLTKLDKEKK